MGKKGGARHLKRMHAPSFWPIHAKEFQWTKKPKPGPHAIQKCLPLSIVIRDILGYTKKSKEARSVIRGRKVRVDGKTRIETKYPAGLMDVIEIPEAKVAVRVLPIQRKGLSVLNIPPEEASFKLCRIEDKRTVPGGDFQLSLHDGRNILVKVSDPRRPEGESYHTFDTIQINLPDQKIIKRIKFVEGSQVLVTSGSNLGRTGRIKKIEAGSAARPTIVTVEDSQSEVFRTVADYVFVVGEEKPIISLGA
jgi:small subunit ribosomal protein S4e